MAEEIGVSILDLPYLTDEQIEAKQAIEAGRAKYRREQENINKAKEAAKKGKHGH